MSPLLSAMTEHGLLDYGSFIPTELVHQALGLVVPEVGTRAEFEAVALRELSAIDDVRGVLLDKGKYLAGCKGGYRILLPSENASQIENYMKSADRKLRRAQRLSAATQREAATIDHTQTRIHMKQHSWRRTSVAHNHMPA